MLLNLCNHLSHGSRLLNPFVNLQLSHHHVQCPRPSWILIRKMYSSGLQNAFCSLLHIPSRFKKSPATRSLPAGFKCKEITIEMTIFNIDANFTTCGRCQWLTRWTPDREVRVRALGGSLCCVLGEDTLLSECRPLSTQEYKWVPANCQGNLTSCWG